MILYVIERHLKRDTIYPIAWIPIEVISAENKTAAALRYVRERALANRKYMKDYELRVTEYHMVREMCSPKKVGEINDKARTAGQIDADVFQLMGLNLDTNLLKTFLQAFDRTINKCCETMAEADIDEVDRIDQIREALNALRLDICSGMERRIRNLHVQEVTKPSKEQPIEEDEEDYNGNHDNDDEDDEVEWEPTAEETAW